jgi:hypothetical protein
VDDYLRGIHPNKKKEEKEEKTNWNKPIVPCNDYKSPTNNSEVKTQIEHKRKQMLFNLDVEYYNGDININM